MKKKKKLFDIRTKINNQIGSNWTWPKIYYMMKSKRFTQRKSKNQTILTTHYESLKKISNNVPSGGKSYK